LFISAYLVFDLLCLYSIIPALKKDCYAEMHLGLLC
jgi:hypothetical protein